MKQCVFWQCWRRSGVGTDNIVHEVPGIFIFLYHFVLQYCRKIYCTTFESTLFCVFKILLLMNARNESDCTKWLFRVNVLGILLLKWGVSFRMKQSHRVCGSNWHTDLKFTLIREQEKLKTKTGDTRDKILQNKIVQYEKNIQTCTKILLQWAEMMGKFVMKELSESVLTIEII